ncbi:MULTISPECIES: bacterio-opsin activator domain-containing protein [Salinibaculum]|uniref:bacterio-opsin activator domain-containing protein n=1 Tax=Salinibaculum TaxID=2732368 RepID=UPI0030CED1C4
MTAESFTETLRETLGLFDATGAPRTTTEVAADLDLGRRSTYERLQRLVDHDRLRTKKVGSSGRVWWRPRPVSSNRENIRSPSERPQSVDDGSAALASLDRYRTLVEHVPNGVVVLVDHSLECLAIGGLTPAAPDVSLEELEGRHLRDVLPGDIAELLVPHYEAALSGETRSFTSEFGPETYKFRMVPIHDEDGDVSGAVGMSQNISEHVAQEGELQRRIQQLEVISDLGQQALADHDLDSLLSIVVGEVADVIGAEYCKVLELDRGAEELLFRQGVGWEDDVVGTETVSAVEDRSQAARTLESQEPVVVSDFATEDRFDGPALLRDHGVASGISAIIGPPESPWGILGVHDTAPREYSEEDVNFVQSVASILANALTRREDERVMARQRERLAALNNLNRVAREIIEAVVEQSTRAEIETTVCERLARSGSYEFAWIGEPDVHSQTVALRTEAGVDGYLDDITISVDPDDERSGGPTGRALLTGEPQVTADVADTGDHDPWRNHVEAHEFRSSVAVPLVHAGSTYGVLNVYADRPHAFEGEELAVVTQLGEVVGYAIAATERKRALMSDDVVELQFRIRDLFDSLGGTAAPGGTVRIDAALPLGDDEFLVYGTVTPDGVDALDELVDLLPHWREVDLADTGDRFELRLSEPPVLSTLAALGGSVEEAVIEDGDYEMRVHVAPSADVRSVIETVYETYPSADLVKRCQVRRETGWSPAERRDPFADLTDRQRTVLEAAYHGGFFDWPRETTGESLASDLGIAPPTFHHHLREAERRVFDALLSTSSDRC